MSTKVPEFCPRCCHHQMPTDKVVSWKGLPLWMWMYDCVMCGWVWVNEAQRYHNANELKRADNMLSRGVGMYG